MADAYNIYQIPITTKAIKSPTRINSFKYSYLLMSFNNFINTKQAH